MVPVGRLVPDKPGLSGQHLGRERHLGADQRFTVDQIQFELGVGCTGQREVEGVALSNVQHGRFLGQHRGLLGRWGDQPKPGAHDEQDHQTNGLCVATPTRHGLRWSLKDLKDTPDDFPLPSFRLSTADRSKTFVEPTTHEK